MKTIILPGYSPHNKEWADEVKNSLKLNHQAMAHYWKHWQSGSFNLNYEVEKILEEAGNDKFNLLAKSVGTRVVASLLLRAKNQINKIILCGIPSTSSEMEESFKKAIEDFPIENILVFQNKKDPFKKYEEIKEFIKKINPKIKVIEKERSDHHYPYSIDFQEFLEK
jgi:predicted alpha/beta hydrolase family esterase